MNFLGKNFPWREHKGEKPKDKREFTQQDFENETTRLKSFLQNVQKSSLRKYVDTFRESIAAELDVRDELKKRGFDALSTDKGVKYLKENY